MERAIVCIGVNRTGGLAVLQDAAPSARRVADWARQQGVQHVRLLTDEDGKPVEIGAVKRAVRELADLGSVEQLVVFFAGHGINVNRGERWLLSDAPADPQAAVNVPGSAELARWGRIPYVVMISDACRTAAEGIQAQGVTGSEIFPNEDVAELELPVDQFFACRLGRPAHEIRDNATTAREYKAIYTAALVSALGGEAADVLDPEGYVRPRPLKRFLQQEVARRLRDQELQTKLIQVPDAHIASDEQAWIARLTARPPGAGVPPPGGPPEDLGPTARTVVDEMLSPLLTTGLERYSDRLAATRASPQPEAAGIADDVERIAAPFGPTHFETGCGFKVRGAAVHDAVGGAFMPQPLPGDVVRVQPSGEAPAGTVLLVLDGGRGIALPAIAGFVTAVTVAGGDVIDVAYEPTEDNYRWPDFQVQAGEVRALRAVAASASREGAFALEGKDALEVARRMQYAKGLDPALAVYAAYAYGDQGRRDLIREMHGFMTADLGGSLFDVALLARERAAGPSPFGFAPLLAQGWALVDAMPLTVAPALRDLERHVVPDSLWTLYDATGAERIREAIVRQEII